MVDVVDAIAMEMGRAAASRLDKAMERTVRSFSVLTIRRAAFSATTPSRLFSGVTYCPDYRTKPYGAWFQGIELVIAETEEEAWVAVPGAAFDWQDERRRGAA